MRTPNNAPAAVGEAIHRSDPGNDLSLWKSSVFSKFPFRDGITYGFDPTSKVTGAQGFLDSRLGGRGFLNNPYVAGLKDYGHSLF